MEVQATVRGSSSQLAVFNGLVADGPLRIDVTRETRSPLRMADALEASALGEIGVNIDDVSPEEMPISVEAIVEATLPVKVQAEDVQLAPTPTVTPDHVTVRLPASKLEMAKELSAIASLRDVQLDQFTVGVPQKVDVTVQLPASLQTPWTQVTPQQASVTFTVRKINDVLTLDRVPVLLSVPPQLLTQWRFELDDRNRVLVGVEIAGPSDAIQAIRDHKLDVFAEVRPRTDDLKEGVAKLTAVVLGTPDFVWFFRARVELPVAFVRGCFCGAPAF